MDDQLQSLLVQALGQNGDADSGALLDPGALLTQYLLQRQVDSGDPDEEEEPLAAAERAELEVLRRRNDVFSAAVGACERCWGEDPTCPVCRGDGRPGWAEPNRGLFAEVAGPALRYLRRSVLDTV